MSLSSYLVRHGQTEYNVQERIRGQSDPDLDVGFGSSRIRCRDCSCVSSGPFDP